MNVSSGSTTVGPETTRIAPINSGTSAPRPPNNSATAPAIANQVSNAPTETSRTTTDRIRGVTSRNESLRPGLEQDHPDGDRHERLVERPEQIARPYVDR